MRSMAIPTEALDWALEQIYAGESQAFIAQALGVSTGHLSESLNAEPYRERSANARKASAEAWLDKGVAVLLKALDDPAYQGSGTDSGAARALAQEYARRAAIRNPAYREKSGVEITGAAGGPIRTIAATVTPEQAAQAYKEVLG